MLIQTRVLSIASVCVIGLYIVIGGNVDFWVQCRRAHDQFDIVCRWERTGYYVMNVPFYGGLPD